MICAWQALINLLPLWMRESTDKFGFEQLQEIRLRLNSPPAFYLNTGQMNLSRNISHEDLIFVVNMATKYSPWASESTAKFYITSPGGHRIGLCGRAINKNGVISGVQNLTSINIRIAKDFPGIAEKGKHYNGSILIIGAPGSGKTTLLRDLIRQKSSSNCICVIDERQEIFPLVNNQFCFPTGKNTDIISGCSKSAGTEAALRNMGPDIIAVDEITAAADCSALVHAGWCGVDLYATAHAENKYDLFHRPVYKPIIENSLFQTIFVTLPDKTWYAERLADEF